MPRPAFKMHPLLVLIALLVTLLSGCMDTLLPGDESEEPGAVTNTPPSTPAGVVATAGDGKVVLAWTAPASFAGGPTDSGNPAVYKHQAWVVKDSLRIFSDTSMSCTAVAPATTCEITGLTNGTEYVFAVAAFNKIAISSVCANHDYPGAFNKSGAPGRSCASVLVRATPNGTILKLPGAPRGVQARGAEGQAIVSWIEPTSTGGAPITGYIVTALSDTLKRCTTTGALTCTVTGLTTGVSYTFVVQAVNSVGEGTEWAASPPVTPAAVPGAPTNVTAVPGRTEVRVSWSAPASNGGAPITGYTVVAVSDSSKTCTTTSALTCTIGALTNGVSYSFVVRATNSSGASAPSVASAAVTPTPPPPWIGRTSGTTNTLRDVSLAGTQFVAVGEAGTILTSTNGTNWTTRNSGVDVDLAAVAGSGSAWVAVGAGGIILTSPTGSNWSAFKSGSLNLMDIVHAGSQWVVVGETGTIFTSPDGATWTYRQSGTLETLNGVSWSGSMLTAVGAGGTIVTSPDGVMWTARSSGTLANLNAITWASNVFVAVGDSASQIRTSPDGITWTSRTTPAPATMSFRDVTWTGNQLLLVGTGGPVYGSITVLGTMEFLTNLGSTMYGAAGSTDQWVVVGTGGVITTSP